MFALIVGGWLGLSIIVGVCAVKNGLNGLDYFLLSLLLSPVVGFAIVAVRQTNEYSSPKEKILPRVVRLKRVSGSYRSRGW